MGPPLSKPAYKGEKKPGTGNGPRPAETEKSKRPRREKFPKGRIGVHKLPDALPYKRCRLKLLKLERILDFLTLEEEYLTNVRLKAPSVECAEDSLTRKIEAFREYPLIVATMEEYVDDTHAIISTAAGTELYVTIMSFVDRGLLVPGCTVMLSHRSYSIVGILSDDLDPMLSFMKIEKAPQETYADVGGLDAQIIEIKEAVELPLTHPQLYEDMGIRPPKGVLLYGPPGTGKTLIAKAVANQTSATFLHIVGSELVQKFIGEGPKLVRELFRMARDYAPSIVFIDEVDAVGIKRYESLSSGEREVQRTMLELLNQLDGFDERGDIKIIMATNRIESLDPALIRPGRIDRKIEFPLPDEATIRRIFAIHTCRMMLENDVNLEEFIATKDELSGADVKAICTESGLIALRNRRIRVCQDDFRKARDCVVYRKKDDFPDSLYL